ncbi:MAG: MATE family efflux transporter [Myxococcales bacterium]|nr:MATE family efflux transporter [Myxococcales bacterium]
MKPITTTNFLSELTRLAVPSALFVLLTNAFRIVDQFWVDRISVAAQAGVGATSFILVVAYASFEIISAGASPLIARYTGANSLDKRRMVIAEGLVACLILGGVWMVVGTSIAPWLVSSLRLEPSVETEARIYLQTLTITSLPLVFTPFLDHSFLSMGDARTPLFLHAISLGGNMILTPLLAVHAELGVAGAAIASHLSRAVGAGAGLYLLWRRTKITKTDLRLGSYLPTIVRLGLPIASGTALYGTSYWLMLRFAVSPLGAHVTAALGIGWAALEGISWPIFHGAGMAVASIIGRRLGAQDRAGAQRFAFAGLFSAVAMGASVTVLFLTAGTIITSPFASVPSVHREAINYATIVGYSQVAVAIESVTEGILAGAGATRWIFWTSAPLNLSRAPLAWLLAIHFQFGSDGLWWVIVFTTWVKTLLKLTLVFRGHWLNELL